MSSIALFNSKHKPFFLVIERTSVFLMTVCNFSLLPPFFLFILALFFSHLFFFVFALTRSALIIFIPFNDQFLFFETPSLEI